MTEQRRQALERLFCRIGDGARRLVLETAGVLGLVEFGGVAATVTEREIHDLRRAMGSGAGLHPWPHLQVGDMVRIERGPLAGMEGPLLRTTEGTRVVLGVQILQRSVAVEVDPESIRLIRRAAASQPRVFAAHARVNAEVDPQTGQSVSPWAP